MLSFFLLFFFVIFIGEGVIVGEYKVVVILVCDVGFVLMGVCIEIGVVLGVIL